ncbi:glycosyltransferase [Niabella drilacis]|uniref:Glycosyltransferase involved in cell wall bisynthesis n=1 Tax=Niabella drilacis (strain DSM 25811 / CCM 8410 / CCUG 62505 / LMG 26954 / E90) TaxID=1285928 RepID=A0A1G6NSJ7_NIADE|nr:glycosyltransferase [Niabella drilacis]SDC70246.1 Glycosyltransferase involved in cell wall bisynthesis [Niabella drilacis]
MAKSLFITYDGLTDPLGQSQILPYLTGLAQSGHSITILSCEKKERFLLRKSTIEQICKAANIKWHYLIFHTSPPILAKYYDLYQLTRYAIKLHKSAPFDIIHCRSYLAAGIGVLLKKRFGVPFLFDMRGFWVDERIDGAIWDHDKWIYKIAYRNWKKKEAQFIRQSDHIVSLTEAAKQEIETWTAYNKSTPITVIPCSADMQLFTLKTNEENRIARQLLNIPDQAFVVSYLGSLGTWYMLDEMLLFYKILLEKKNEVFLLVLTPDDREIVYQAASRLGLDEAKILVQFANREDVPKLIKASDISLSFIKPAYSKIASSPTKLGELLAMGISVICNKIGDVEKIVSESNGGFILNNLDVSTIKEIVAKLEISDIEPINRDFIIAYYSLEHALDQYRNIYQEIRSLSG